MTESREDRRITIGVAGGSGSGKTTVARWLLKRIGVENISYLPHDAYYKDLGNLPPDQRVQVNFDHPDSLDTDLFKRHILTLRRGEAIEMPVYDFSTHTRTDKTVRVGIHRIILVEGILIFADPDLRDLFDVRIFVDTEDDVRFIRRLQRDTRERGRTVESVINQWMSTVRPMYQEFVEPTKRYAHVIIPEGGHNEVAMEMVAARIQSLREQI